MADKKFNLVFNASLEVGQVKAAIASLTKSLESASAKIPQSMTTNLNHMIQSLSTELNKLEGMTDIQLDPKNAKNVGKSYEKIFQTFQQIKVTLGDIYRTAGIDPEKFFPSEIASNIAKAVQAVQKYKKTMETGVKTEEHTKATKDIAEAEKKVKSLNNKLDEAARKRQSSSMVKYQLQETRKKLQAEKDQAEAEDKAAKEAQKAIQDRIKSQERLAQIEEEIIKKKKKQQEEVNKAAKANEVKNERESMKQAKGKGTDTKIYKDAVASYTESTAEVQKLQSEIDQLEAEYTQLSQTATATADEIAATNKRVTKAAAELTNAQKRLNKNQTDIDAADTKYTTATAEVKTLVPEVQKAEEALNQLIQKREQLEASFEQVTFDELIQELEKLGVKLPDTERNMDGVERALESMASEAGSKVVSALDSIKDAAESIEKPMDEIGKKADGIGGLGEQARRAEQDMENLKNQVLQFFSITNAIQLFKRIVQSALNTVKELDAVMTETAVVTDFTVGDMWEKLPQYSKEASALGASIRDLYSATTLYYQQGLQTEAAMGVGVETMKMARIANMDAADATQAMTAALRGFNMEVNELNAQKVNDVYSELAAITAADTSQIATAMSKTASIAASANMEFETTAALLSQIIETTQEAPETAGTAMKTIIARFTEVKELFSEGMLTGEDEEGEEININKIDAALKTVGISLKDFLNGSKGIDDIFLELASKWDTLDLATQRYIATMAAGSRQQSRFIAMMSNYDRTMELVTAANNSAGASQEQFDKTLESLEAKLQKLSNAWDEFVMGLANNEIIKLGVDLLTGLLETINNVTSALSGGNGLVKSIVSLVTVIGALKGGKLLFDNLFGGAAKQIGEIDLDNGKKGAIVLGKNLNKQAVVEGQKAGKGFAQAFKLSSGFELKNFFGSQVSIYSEQAKTLWTKDAVQFIKGAQASIFKNTEGVGDKVAEMNEINSALARQEMSFDQAKAKAKEYGLELISSGKHGHQFNVIGKETTLNLKNIGTAAIAAGSAITLLGELFKKIGAEKAGEAIQKIGTAITAVGSVIAAITPILNAFGVTIGSFGIAVGGTVVASLGAIAAVAGPLLAVLGALVGIFIAIRNASPEYQLKKAAEAAEHAGEAANSAAEAYTNLKSSLDSIEEKENVLENLTTSTQEWRDAVSELNNEMLSLIEKYPELAQYVESVNGVLNFTDDEAVEQIVAQYENNKTKAKAAEMAAKIEVERKQQGVGYSDLSAETKNLATQALVGTATEYFVNSDGSRYTHDEFIAAQGEYGIDAETAEIQWNNAILETDVDYEQDTIDLAKAIASGNWDEEQVEALGGKDSEAFLELKKLGQEIIASEAAIKVFTDSLIDSALTTAEISNENAKNMRNMYDTEAIEAMIKEAEGEIDLSDEQVKKDYAKYMGYDYENGKFYSGEGEDKKEVTVLDKDIKSQMAAIAVQDDMAKKAAKLSSILPGLEKSSKQLDVAFGNVIEKADGAALTLSDLETLEKAEAFDEEGKLTLNEDRTGFVNENIQELYSKVADVYDPETFARMVENAYQSGKEARDYSSKKLGSMGLSGDLFSKANIDTGSLGGIVNELYDVFITSGRGATEEVSTQINDIMNQLNPEQAQIFAEGLNMIDWDNVDSIDDLSEVLESMDFKGPIKNIETLEQVIIDGTKAARNFSLEEVREELKSLGGIVKDLKAREDDERTFTTEEKDEILKNAPQFTGEFVMTGADEWVFIGDSIADLILALNSNTDALLGNTGEQLKEKADKAQDWQNMMDSEGKRYTMTTKQYVGSELEEIVQNLNFSEVMEKINRGEFVSDSILTSILNQMGESTDGDNAALTERVKQGYQDYYLNGQTHIQNWEDWQDNEETYRLTWQDPYKLASQVRNTETKYNGRDLETTTVDNSQVLKALEAQATQAGVTAAELEHYKKVLGESGKSGDELTAAAYAMATSMKKQQAAINEASEAIGKYLETMDDAEKGSVTYNEALSAIPKQLEKAFGFEPSMEWVQDNLDLIKKWAAGSEEAGAQIWENLTNGFSSAMAACEASVGQSVTNMVDWLNWFSGTNVWASAYLDNSGFMNAIATSETKAKEFADWLAEQGYETELIQLAPKPMVQKVGKYNGSMMEWTETTVMQPQYQIKWKNTGNPWTSGGGGGYNAPSSYTPKSSGGGGGGGSKPEKWENPYDEFYNTVEKLNEELRTREKLERRYQKLLDNTNTKASDLVKNAREQLASLEEERKTREYLLKGRERQMADIEREYNNLGKYAWYNEEKQVIEINWTKIEALDGSTNEKLTSRIEEYIKKLEEQQDLIEEEQDSIAEIEDAVKEIREQGKDEYFDLESQIKEALEQARQEEIDKLSAINDSINDTNSRLIDAMQSSIDKYRQDRENERTEEELSDKQRRLAYLQQDTSGANALEIMQLQEEIDQGMENYTDQLIDQKINDLQEQNDKAAEQREKQIDLMQAQLDHYLDSELVWADIYELMNGGIGPDGIIAGSALEQLLMEGASFEAMSYLEKMKWLEELENNVAKAVQWLMEGNSTEALMAIGDLNKGQKIEFTTADGEKVSGTLDEAGNVITDSGEKYEGVYRTYNGAFVTQENYIKPEPPKPEPQPDPESQPESEKPKAPKLTKDIKRGVSAAIWNGNYGWGVGGTRSKRLSEVFGANDIQRNYVDKYVTSGYSGSLSDYSYVNMRRKFKQYKTGGLADFTGPAWLDGTKSKPEYILNAEQTKSFFELVDVLSGLKGGTSQSSQITGDSIYDVDINVESIGSDYDVEKLATTIKRMINDDARYRNNNAINLQR